jgi:hypothetical protein
MKQAEKTAEPPSSLSRLPNFMIGRDSQCHWIVCEPNGTRGGLFVNRAEALRYIRFENENHVRSLPPDALAWPNSHLYFDDAHPLPQAIVDPIRDPLLGRVDGFDQDKAESKRDE